MRHCSHRLLDVFLICLVGIVTLFFAGLRVAEANWLCPWLGPCLYESPGFRFTVVDKETGQPLADVFALAEWIQYGRHGRNGPIMVQDAVSDPDGRLVFPPWGPIQGSPSGLVLNHDPFMTLFRPGYRTLAMTNRVSMATEETTRVRRFGQDGQTIAMERFRETPEEWMRELDKLRQGAAASMSVEQFLQFRVPYLKRAKRLWSEREEVPPKYREPGEFLWHVERTIRRLEEGKP